MEFLFKDDQVDGLPAFGERDHLREDAAVLVEEEIFRAETFDCRVEGIVVQKHGGQNGTLRLEILGKRRCDHRSPRTVSANGGSSLSTASVSHSFGSASPRSNAE